MQIESNEKTLPLDYASKNLRRSNLYRKLMLSGIALVLFGLAGMGVVYLLLRGVQEAMQATTIICFLIAFATILFVGLVLMLTGFFICPRASDENDASENMKSW
jgi:hypothetical protein